MYAIISGNVVVGMCDSPNYIKDNNGVFIQCDESEAEGVAIGGVAYSIGGNELDGKEKAFVQKIDGAEFLFSTSKELKDSHNASVERLDSIEDALCDISREVVL